MFCKRCGVQLEDDASVCPSCNTVLRVTVENPATAQSSVPQGKFDSGLALAIISTLCCCMPLGIVSIIYAAQASSAFSTGNYEKAQNDAGIAKKWAIASIITGAVLNILFFVLQFFSVLIDAGH